MQNLDSFFSAAERIIPNPFREDVFLPGATPLPGVVDIHAGAMSYCIKAFENLLREPGHGHGGAGAGGAGASWDGTGRTILIAAPRAGYGKSHLIGRIRGVTESLVAAVSLPFDPARALGWETMLDSLVNQYRSARCPQHLGCTLFDETARWFQSRLARAALDRGAIDERDCPESEVAMRVQFRDVFDPKAATKMAAWLGKRGPELLDGAGRALGERWNLEFEDLVFWHRIFLEAGRPKNDVFEKLRALAGAEARERLLQFFRIATDCRPVAFVADHLDGFFGSEKAGMRIAEILTGLRAGVPRSVTLLCLNEDLWDSIFENRIPSAWTDRLTGEPAVIAGVSPEAAETLIHARLHHAGFPGGVSERFLAAFRENTEASSDTGKPLFPREVLRRASRLWDDLAPELLAAAGPAVKPQAPFVAEAPAPPAASPVETPRTAPVSPPSAPPAAMQNPFYAAPQLTPPPRSSVSPAPQGPVPGIFFPAPSRERPARPVEPLLERGGEPRTPPPPAAPASPDTVSPREDPAAAAARAAGMDITRRLTDIEAIISEIRGGGARAVSETPGGGRAAPAKHGANGHAAPAPPAGDRVEPAPAANPFRTQNLEQRLQELESASLAAPRLAWDPRRIERLVRAIGRHYPAVGQTEHTIGGPGGGKALRWRVKGYSTVYGFEAPDHLYFWSALLHYVTGNDEQPAKIAVLSHPSSRFDYRSLAGFGVDASTALRYFDVIDVNDGDLAMLRAAEQFLAEAEAEGQADQAIRVVARRLDPFWRRLTRPLSVIQTAE